MILDSHSFLPYFSRNMNPDWFVTLLTLIVSGLVGTSGLNYLGCFNGNAIGIETLKEGSRSFSRPVTLQYCRSYCISKGLHYFSIHRSNQCVCLMEMPARESIAEEFKCSITCKTNQPWEPCGKGIWMKVYETGVMKAENPKYIGTAKYVGCYKHIIQYWPTWDNKHLGFYKEFPLTLTNRGCISYCRSAGYSYSGTEYRFICYCAKERPSMPFLMEDENCNYRCDGNANENCGGSSAMSIYQLNGDELDHARPFFEGCYEKSSLQQDFRPRNVDYFKKKMTPEFCIGYCARRSYRHVGMEAGNLCYCLRGFDKGTKVNEIQCSSPCSGESKVKCGGIGKLSVYKTGVEAAHALDKVTYMGCYSDISESKKLLQGIYIRMSQTLTNDKCIIECSRNKYKYAGTEYGFQCRCDNTRPHFKWTASEKDCDAPCDGRTNETCGGSSKVTLFDINDGKIDYVYSNFVGCYEISIHQKYDALSGEEYSQTSLTPESCMGHCYRKRYVYGGLTAGSYCYCHDGIDAIKTDNSRCNSHCSGDSKFYCGGRGTISVYRTGIKA